MKKDVIPEIPEDARAMFPVDPRILVRRAPSRDFVAILERGVTLVFTRVGVETRIGSHTTAPRAREETATPRSPHHDTIDAESFFSSNALAGCGGRGRAPRDARGDDSAAALRARDGHVGRRRAKGRRLGGPRVRLSTGRAGDERVEPPAPGEATVGRRSRRQYLCGNQNFTARSC